MKRKGFSNLLENIDSAKDIYFLPTHMFTFNLSFQDYIDLSNRIVANKQIRKIYVSIYAHYDSEDVIIKFRNLMSFIYKTSSIKEIDFKGSKFSEETFKILFKLLKDGHSIEKLSFKSCKMSSMKTIYRLAGFVEKSQSLKELNLTNCGLCGSGADILSKAIMKNSSLVQLNLSSNNISLSGADSLAKVLKKKFKIRELNLENNVIGNMWIEWIIQSLLENNSLIYLKLSGNDIDYDLTSVRKVFKESYALLESPTKAKIKYIDNIINDNQEKAKIYTEKFIEEMTEIAKNPIHVNEDGEVVFKSFSSELLENIQKRKGAVNFVFEQKTGLELDFDQVVKMLENAEAMVMNKILFNENLSEKFAQCIKGEILQTEIDGLKPLYVHLRELIMKDEFGVFLKSKLQEFESIYEINIKEIPGAKTHKRKPNRVKFPEIELCSNVEQGIENGHDIISILLGDENMTEIQLFKALQLARGALVKELMLSERLSGEVELPDEKFWQKLIEKERQNAQADAVVNV